MHLIKKVTKSKYLISPVYMGMLAILLASLYVSGCEPSSGQSAPPSLLKVPVAQPLQQEITEWDEYTGRFKAIKKVEVRARVSGYVDEVRFNDGELVKNGDVLFRIDPRPFNIALRQAEAQLEQAKAGERQAQSAFDRVKSLKGSKAISQEEFDQREQALYGASAQVAASAANVAQARLNLQFTVVTAPISGKVSEEFVTEGNLISGGSDQATLLTTIVSLDPIYFYFEGSESALLKYSRQRGHDSITGSSKPHNQVLLKLLDEEKFQHEGIMNFMDNEVDFSTGTFQGRAIVPNPDFVIESGMFGTARVLNMEQHQVILVPDAIIATDQSQKIVYVLSDSNTVVAKPVQLGPLHTSELRIIRSGLNPDDQIIVGNIQKIRPDMEVEPEVRTLASNIKN